MWVCVYFPSERSPKLHSQWKTTVDFSKSILRTVVLHQFETLENELKRRRWHNWVLSNVSILSGKFAPQNAFKQSQIKLNKMSLWRNSQQSVCRLALRVLRVAWRLCVHVWVHNTALGECKGRRQEQKENLPPQKVVHQLGRGIPGGIMPNK